jgi:hypothetical protein
MFRRWPKNSKRVRKTFFSSQQSPSLTPSERLRFEEPEPRTMLDATPMISEFLAANSTLIRITIILNPTFAIFLLGYHSLRLVP